MSRPTLHIHEARLGAGLPSRTVRPWRRRGDAILEAFLSALREPADRVVLTGRLFLREDPPAHLVNRVVAPLGDLTRRGLTVSVSPGTPRALLLLAAGIGLKEEKMPPGASEFHGTGAYRLIEGEEVEERRAPLPGTAVVRFDVTGLSSSEAFAGLGERLRAAGRDCFLRVILLGRTAEPELLSFGPRQLTRFLTGGVEGAVENRLEAPGPQTSFPDEASRRAALGQVRASLPELPVTTGIYEFVDRRGRSLYVGKAVDLRRRIASHFTAEAREASPRGPMLLAARSVRYRETGCELSALLAEADRIREVRPPYNRRMRDREGYRYLRADPDGPIPSLVSAPTVVEDGADWFGPFPKRWLVERSLRVLQVIFGLPACSWRPGREPPRACTDRDLAICAAPCAGRATLSEVRERLEMALDHLTGRGSAPSFGTLNPLSAGLLSAEDLRILDGFARSVRRFLENLGTATGTVPLPEGRNLLVLGGLAAGERPAGPRGDRWAAERIEEFSRLPPRTWVPADRSDEARILSHWLRRERADPSPQSPRRGRDGLLFPGRDHEDPGDA